MDVSSLYAEIGRLLNDPNNTRWSTSILLTRINLAQTNILSYTNAVKTMEQLTPTAGDPIVQVDSNTMDIVRVHIKNSSGEWRKLEGIFVDELDFQDPNWRQREDGQPVRYWWDGTNQQINLVPAASTEWANAAGLQVWEVQEAVDLVSPADVPFADNAAMVPYHMAIVHWVVAQCWMDDGTPEALGKSKFHRTDDFSRPGKFEMEIKKIWQKFDAPEDIPANLLWKPTGGRASGNGLGDRKVSFF